MRGKLQGVGGIFIPHFERSEIVAGPPADLPAEVSTQAGPSDFGSDIFKQTPPIETSAYSIKPPPKMEIPGIGWLAYGKDTEGSIFGVMEDISKRQQ